MTPQAIRDGFSRLRSGKPKCSGLADAAVCRSESDWLVGINGTRAMTAFNSKTGGFHLTTVGRVQTPTLALIVDREDRIRKFKPRAYWEVEGRLRLCGRRIPGQVVRREIQGQGRRRTCARRPPVGRSPGDRAAAEVRRQGRRSQRGVQGVDPAVAAALRSDQPAARSQRPLRLLRQGHARFGAGALRKAQGTDLSAYRLPCATGRLPPTVKETLAMLTGEGAGKGHDEATAGSLRAFCTADPGSQLGRAEQAHLQQRQDLRSLRDHPDAAGAEAPLRARVQALRHGRQALPRGLLSRQRNT
jgi:DNA topoisomerase-3